MQIFAGPPIYHLPGNVITAALDYIDVLPEYDRLVSDNSRRLTKFELGTLSSQPPLQKIISAGVWVHVNSYLPVTFGDDRRICESKYENVTWSRI